MKTKLILDVNKTQYAQLNSIVTGRVGDKVSNVVDVYVIDGGSPYNLTGLKVFFECAKPDNTVIRDNNGVTIIDAAKGHFEYTFPTETFGAIGKAKQAFMSIEKDKTIRATTQDFVLITLPDATTNRIPSESYLSDLEKLIQELNELALKEINSQAAAEASAAKNFANQANELSISIQKQLNEIVINGDSSVEAAQARVDLHGYKYELLKPRLDAEQFKVEMTKRESSLLSNFFLKLRKKQNVRICCMGDSMTYGSDFNSSDKRPADTKPTDNGTAHTATRASTTYPEALQKHLNKVYGNIVTVINHGYSGDGAKNGYEKWNASGADLCIIDYGINDASNTNISYMGNIEEYLKWYRKIIERELDNGTPVIIMTPTKQRIPAGTADSYRTDVDVFAEAARILAKEYNISVINGQEMLLNYSADIYSDLTHLNGVGYDILGARVASTLVGKGINDPFVVTEERFQGVMHHLHSVTYNGGYRAYSEYYPTASEQETGKGSGAVLSPGEKLFFSVYVESDGMVALPGLFSSATDVTVRVSLDFAVNSPDYSNDYYFGRPPVSNVDIPFPVPYIDIPKSKFNAGSVFSGAFLDSIQDPMLFIATRGWHTISVENISTEGSVTLHGIDYFSYTRMKDRYGNGSSPIKLTLENGVTNFYSYPLSATKSNGIVTINGVLNNIPSTKPSQVATLPVGYRPLANLTFVVALSSSTGGGYATVLIEATTGAVKVVYMSNNVAFCNMNGIVFQVK
ncbi:BppU family phage baseplate upper protein [Bacillus sp. NA_146.1]